MAAVDSEEEGWATAAAGLVEEDSEEEGWAAVVAAMGACVWGRSIER